MASATGPAIMNLLTASMISKKADLIVAGYSGEQRKLSQSDAGCLPLCRNVRENIRHNQEITPEQIGSRHVNAHHFIDKLPKIT